MSEQTYLPYRLTLRSPAIVSTLAGDPNSATTQPFIPGSAIRGALAARLLAAGDKGDSEAFPRLILSGQVRYLHAYPELAGDRALPTPAAWKSKKEDTNSSVDLAAFSGAVDTECDHDDLAEAWPTDALAAISWPFIAATISSGSRTVTAPRVASRLHQQRDRVKGRPWKDRNEQSHGVLFSYEYIEPDQVFRGVIQFRYPAKEDIVRIQELLSSGHLLVGRSRRTGYGGEAEIVFMDPAQREYENVFGIISNNIPAGKLFRAMLTSAYVGRHPMTGQFDPAALEHELNERLGDTATLERRRWAFETIGAFNQKWRLEVPQTLTVAGGALFVLKATADIPLATLQAIEHDGLGERRTEGFGRVLFLGHTGGNAAFHLRQGDEAGRAHQGATSTEALSLQDREQLAFLEQRIVLAAAKAELDRVAAIDLAAGAKRRPTSSLLGRLRTLFRDVQDEATARTALDNLAAWCSDDDNPNALKKNAREKLDRCQIRETNLRQWLRTLAEPGHGLDGDGWEALVKASGNQATLTGLASKSHLTTCEAAQDVLHAHAAQLRVYLIDSVLGTMARLNRRGA